MFPFFSPSRRLCLESAPTMSARAYEEQYGYNSHLRRHSSVLNEKSPTPAPLSPRRKPVRSQSTRASNGTVSTTMSTSTGRMSQATNITQPPSYSKKFVVVGDGGCGKTCLLISYSQGYFPEVSDRRWTSCLVDNEAKRLLVEIRSYGF